MSVFYNQGKGISDVEQENFKPTKILKAAGENRRRVPLQCITNGNGGVKRNRDFDDNCASNTITSQIKTVELETCLQLVSNENSLTKCSYNKENKNSEDDIVLNEYGKDIWKYLLSQEEKYFWPKPNYMFKQKQITFEMRGILIDWLVAVAQEYDVHEQTIHLSVNFIDRFLCTMSVVRDKFQLLGATAMMLAIKIEEVVALDAEEWEHLTGQAYNSRQITRMEQLLLSVLKFDLNPPTVINFIQLICSTFKLDNKTMYLAMFLAELTLLEGQSFLEYVPSKLAVASIVLARYLLRKRNPYFLKLETSCGYNFKQLKPVIIKQHRTFEDSPSKELKSIQNKYKTNKYHCVANVVPLRLNFEDE